MTEIFAMHQLVVRMVTLAKIGLITVKRVATPLGAVSMIALVSVVD